MSDSPILVRQDHYGEGRQPWDDIVDSGWGAEFAAGNILKYLRRTKDHEHSIESARWYYSRLTEMVSGELIPTPQDLETGHAYNAFMTMKRLHDVLSSDERDLLTGESLQDAVGIEGGR